jgi:hypothetical protein
VNAHYSQPARIAHTAAAGSRIGPHDRERDILAVVATVVGWHEVLHCSGERRRVDRPRHDPPVRVSAGVRMAELSFDVAIEIEMTARVRD